MRIAHLSDPHILNLAGVPTSRLLLNKRFTGWVNLKLHRGSRHKHQVVEAMMDDIRAGAYDHVVVTGDVSNLALEPEFERAREIFARAGLSSEQLSVVPGNHDVYTSGAEKTQRFFQFFAPNATSDLPAFADPAHPSGPFPFVRLRDGVALIGLSTAVARLPMVAAGRAGERQLRALADALEHPEVKKRTPVILVHHPLINPRRAFGRVLRGLGEAGAIREILARRRNTLVLHGHLHHRAHRVLDLPNGGAIQHFAATSASLLHHAPDRVAGYNVYEMGPEGLERASARVWDAENGAFVDGVIERRGAEHAD